MDGCGGGKKKKKKNGEGFDESRYTIMINATRRKGIEKGF